MPLVTKGMQFSSAAFAAISSFSARMASRLIMLGQGKKQVNTMPVFIVAVNQDPDAGWEVCSRCHSIRTRCPHWYIFVARMIGGSHTWHRLEEGSSGCQAFCLDGSCLLWHTPPPVFLSQLRPCQSNLRMKSPTSLRSGRPEARRTK